MRPYIIPLFALAFGLGGCSGDNFSPGTDPPVGTKGELGNGTFFYECATQADPVCDDGDADYPFDRDYAVGARFGMRFRDETNNSATLISSAPERLDGQDGDFEVSAAGTVAVIAKRGERVMDIIHLRMRDVVDVDVEAELTALGTGDGTVLELEVGSSVDVRAKPVDDDGTVLVGALPTSWSTDDSTIADFLGADDDNIVQVSALAPGETMLVLHMGEFEKTIPVVVSDDGSGGTGGTGGTGGNGGNGGEAGEAGAGGGS